MCLLTDGGAGLDRGEARLRLIKLTKPADCGESQLRLEQCGHSGYPVADRSGPHYDGHFFDYPLEPLNALAGLGPLRATLIALSYLRSRLRPIRPEVSFEDWVVNRFGRRLYETFFKAYTEKV